MRNQTVFSYLHRREAGLLGVQSRESQFSRPALTTLTQSNAYRNRDLARLKELAQHLKAANQPTIALARTYPEIFHPNVARSRRVENRIYTTVIRLISCQQDSEAA